jgi:hypothetical protein
MCLPAIGCGTEKSSMPSKRSLGQEIAGYLGVEFYKNKTGRFTSGQHSPMSAYVMPRKKFF